MVDPVFGLNEKTLFPFSVEKYERVFFVLPTVCDKLRVPRYTTDILYF